jgi:hypothetical protein
MNQFIEQRRTRELRSFGVTVGAVFLAIGIWPVVWSGQDVRLWAVAVGSLLLIAGGLVPSVLAPVHRLWMTLGHWMGWVNTRIILGIFFYGILTPMGLAARMMGKDFMRMKSAPGADTYRVVRSRRSPTHVRHQF